MWWYQGQGGKGAGRWKKGRAQEVIVREKISCKKKEEKTFVNWGGEGEMGL